MSRSNEHVHGSRRLRRALGLGLSGAALVGLIYFEGLSARAEASAEASLADEAEDLEVEAGEAAVEEAAVEEAAVDEAAVEGERARDGEGLATARDAAKVEPVILPPSGAARPEAAAADQLAVATIADAAAAMPVAPPAPALVVVPDIEGMSLRKAKKQLAAVGLALSVRDEYGEKIPRDYWGEYKVRTQKLDAGTEVAPGSTVKVKARMRMRYAMGY
jgi:hypothetical protein